MYPHVYQPLHGNQGNDTCSEHGDRQMPLAINMFWWLKVTGCAFSPRGNEVCSCAKDATLKIWAFPSGELKRTIANCDGSKAIACAYSPDGGSICTGGFDKTLKLFDAATGELHRVIGERTLVQDSSHWSFIRGCAFSPDGGTLVSCAGDETCKLWDVERFIVLHLYVALIESPYTQE